MKSLRRKNPPLGEVPAKRAEGVSGRGRQSNGDIRLQRDVAALGARGVLLQNVVHQVGYGHQDVEMRVEVEGRAEEFEALRAYSPYNKVEQGACYPPILTMVGERDQTAVPMHGYKFTAALQHAAGCDNPAMLKIIRGAGHSHGTTSEQQAQTWADALAFILKALNLASQ